MSVQITNEGRTLKVVNDNSIISLNKEGMSITAVDEMIQILTADGQSPSYEFTEVTVPSNVSADDLRDEIVKLINRDFRHDSTVQEYEFGTAADKISFAVPTGFNLFIEQWHVSFSEGDKYLIELEDDGVPLASLGGGEGKTGGGPMIFPDDNPLGPIAAGSTVTLNREEGDAGKDWSGGFIGYLEEE